MRLKLIALAVSGLAATGSANAAFDIGAGDFNGTTELFAVAYDPVANIQGFFDLGVSITDWTAAAKSGPNITNTWNFATDRTTGLGGVSGNWSTAWNTFAASATPANTRWMMGGYEFDALAVGLTTSTTRPEIVVEQLDGAFQNFPATIAFLNSQSFFGNHTTVANGANNTQVSANPSGVIGGGFGPSWNGNFIGEFSAPINTAQPGYYLVANFTGGFADVTQYAGQFELSSAGVLSYTTPVPEPETYALMLAGLGMVGLIARRRRNM